MILIAIFTSPYVGKGKNRTYLKLDIKLKIGYP